MADAFYCTNCRKPVSETDVFCRHCGAVQRASAQQTSVNSQAVAPNLVAANSKRASNKTCLGCFGFILFLSILGSIFSKLSEPGSSSTQYQTTEEKARAIEIGTTKQQVINRLGGTDMATERLNPDYVPGQGKSVLLYDLPDDGTVSISFNNDKVISMSAWRNKQIIFEKGNLSPDQ